MAIWSMFVEGISALLAQLAQMLDGSFGLAIIALALFVRLMLLPMTLKVAEQGWHRQRQMAALKPKLERLRERHAKDPAAYASATQALYREHGVTAGLGSSLRVAVVQAPIGAGIYAAIRQGVAGAGAFLWIPKLARPDLWLAVIVAALSLAAMLLNPSMPEQTRTLLQLLPVVISFVVVWHLAAGLGLYWAGSTSVNLLQILLLRRRIRRMPS
jgi:YidC/Oxa1 family membrane protein insertase